MRKPTIKTAAYLAALLEWAKGNRGPKDNNPYCVPEVKAALDHLAYLQGIPSWQDAETAELAKQAAL